VGGVVVVRDTTLVGGGWKHYFLFEGSQAMPAAVYFAIHTEHTDTVRTSQETHYISATEPTRLMLLAETVAVYFAIHTNTQIQSVPHRKHITSPL
jgi:hypothetical protein